MSLRNVFLNILWIVFLVDLDDPSIAFYVKDRSLDTSCSTLIAIPSDLNFPLLRGKVKLLHQHRIPYLCLIIIFLLSIILFCQTCHLFSIAKNINGINFILDGWQNGRKKCLHLNNKKKNSDTVQLPFGNLAVGCRWVYTVKVN